MDHTANDAPGATLAAWLQEERAVRAVLDAGVGAGVAQPEQWGGRSGLEQMQAMLRGELPYPPIAATLDFQLVRVAAGEAVFQGTPGPAHLNPRAACTAAGSPRCWIRPSAARCTP